jgi:hypothetical protein
VPIWAWFIPLIMISKPAAFASFPAMIFAAIISKPRFRVITILTAIACIIQLIRVYLSYSSGVLQPSNDFTIYDKLYAFAHYSLGFLGLYFFRSLTGNSQWQKMATAIDMGDSLCVPINPLGWIYGRNCQLLNQEDPKGKPIVYEESTTKAFTIEIPPSISSRTLISLAMLIKPYSMAQTPISGELELIMNDGTIKYMIGSNKLPSTGGLLMFTSHGEEIAMAKIKRITARLSLPVTRAYVEATTPAILWLGR